MHFLTIVSAVLTFTVGVVRSDDLPYNVSYTGYPPPYCSTNVTAPTKWGILLYRAYTPLDVFGPIAALEVLGRQYHTDMSFIAETLDPVTTRPQMAAMNKLNSTTFVEKLIPTYTFNTAPSDLEVLLIPGGAGSRAPDLNSTLAFVKETFPKIKYLITVCTGSLVASRAGVLDGKRATTNKMAWASVVPTNPKVYWVPHARWTADGNIWTSSGVSAGIDATLAFIACFYGQDMAEYIANSMEYERHSDSYDDAFSAYYNVTYRLVA